MNQFDNNNGEWTLLDESGGVIVSFTSFLDISFSNSGKVLSQPVEEGAFASYHKSKEALDINVNLGFQGTPSDFEYALLTLDKFQKEAATLSVSTPSTLYRNMTLESYSYERSKDSGAGMIAVKLHLVEVREVKTQSTKGGITSPRNPSSASPVNRGRVQALDITPFRNALYGLQ